jgi:hypothetical protein
MENTTPSAYELDLNAGAKSFETLEAIKGDISEEDYEKAKAQIVRVQLHRTEFVAGPISIPKKGNG